MAAQLGITEEDEESQQQDEGHDEEVGTGGTGEGRNEGPGEDQAESEDEAEEQEQGPDHGPRGKDASDRVLVAGDRVLAKYKGRGTKFFPGKIAAVRLGEDGEARFSIHYDDGDTEDGALPASVRRVGESQAESSEDEDEESDDGVESEGEEASSSASALATGIPDASTDAKSGVSEPVPAPAAPMDPKALRREAREARRLARLKAGPATKEKPLRPYEGGWAGLTGAEEKG